MVQIYTIRDVIAELVAPPFMARNRGQAIRQYHHMFSQAPLIKPDDYVLLHVADMNEETGEMQLIIPVQVVPTNYMPRDGES